MRHTFLLLFLWVAMVFAVAALFLPSPVRWGILLLGLGGLALIMLGLRRFVYEPLERLVETPGKDGVVILPLEVADSVIGRIQSTVYQQSVALNDLIQEGELLATIFDVMTDGVIVTDHNGIINTVNPAAARIFDLDAEAVIGRTFAQAIQHHQLIELWQQTAAADQPHNSIIDLSQKNLFIQVSIAPMQTNRSHDYLLLVHDLTTVRRLETVRRDFISNLSHELRTPLASLSAVLETLQDGALDDPPAACRFVGRAALEVGTMTQMVEELLELARIESGKVPFQFVPAPLEPIVVGVVERLRRSAEQKQLRIDIDLPANLPDILIDPPRIEQVVSNLLHNAIKFSYENGKITLRVAQVDADTVQLSVKDQGIGIPREHLERIFERFYKSDRARTERGTGLGLAIAKHIVQAHRGKIWAKSRDGKGSTFFVQLPISSP